MKEGVGDWLVVLEWRDRRDGADVRGRRMSLRGADWTVGRVFGNTIVVPKGNCSKRHQRLVVKDGRLIIVDLKSTNGSWVALPGCGARKLTSPLFMPIGSKVYISDLIYEVVEIRPATGQDEPGAIWLDPADDRFWPRLPVDEQQAPGFPTPARETIRATELGGAPPWIGRDLLNRVFSSTGTTAIDAGPLVITSRSTHGKPFVHPGGDAASAALIAALNEAVSLGGEPAIARVSLFIRDGASTQTVTRALRSLYVTARRTGVALQAGTVAVTRGEPASPELDLDVAVLSERPGERRTIRARSAVLTAPLGRHGAALIAASHPGLEAHDDLAYLGPLVRRLREAGHSFTMKTLDRPGGFASAAQHIVIREADPPVAPEARAVAEAVGVDPLELPSGGALLLFEAADPLEDLRAASELSARADHVGTMTGQDYGHPTRLLALSPELGTG